MEFTEALWHGRRGHVLLSTMHNTGARGSGNDGVVAGRGGPTHSDSLLRFLSGTSEAIMLPI